MQFPFVIRKLKKILRNEENLAMHHDRFAPGRIPEIKKAIEVLTVAPDESKKPREKQLGKSITNQISLFK